MQVHLEHPRRPRRSPSHALGNESRLYEEDGAYRVDGDPTEGARIVFASKAGLAPDKEREDYPQVAIIPFESERQYMATLHRHGPRKVIFVKGSLDRLLDICTECMITGALRQDHYFRVADAFGNDGLRVLAMAYKEIPADLEEITHADLEKDLVFAGLQGMIDPPREAAGKAERYLHGFDQEGFRIDTLVQDGVIRQIEIIGEAAKRASRRRTRDELSAASPIPPRW